MRRAWRRSALVVVAVGMVLGACSSHPSSNASARPCPSGRDLLALADGDNGSSSVIVAAHGRSKRRTLGGASTDTSPSLAPDGRHVAVADAPGPGAYESEGPGEQRIWVLDTTRDRGYQLTDGELDDDPAWSPDGRWIAYTHRSVVEGGAYRYEIDVIHPGGTGRRTVWRSPRIIETVEWSPDSRSLLSIDWSSTSDVVLRTIAVSSGRSRTVAKVPYLSDQAVWNPDGRSLLLVAHGLQRIDLRTGKRQRVASGAENPAWSQDGKRLYVTRPDPSGRFERRIWQGHLEHGRLRFDRALPEGIEPYFYLGITIGPCLPARDA